MSQQRSRRLTIDPATGPHANKAAGKPAFDELKASEFRQRGERSRRQRSLQERTEVLSELNRRKDEFLAMVSHELRNPLGAIRNAVHVLNLLRNEDALQEKARTIIEHQVAQLTRLVDDLLEVSRIATGKLDLRQDRVVMSGIVERAVETARPLMNLGRHELGVSLSPQPVWLFADAARLEQVVVNLLVNAAKYTGEGGQVRLTVGQEDGECVLRVRDTGVGIAPGLLPHVFDLFTQEKRSQEQSCGGLGIGLALVKQLVEMHKGRVEVHSTVGRGSEFVVRLPVVSPATQPPAEHLMALGIFQGPRLPSNRDSMVG
jgi:signal transduction histidine kinase